MVLPNAHTSVDSSKTVGEIIALLVKEGAEEIHPVYGPKGLPTALGFIMPTATGTHAFRLPVNVERIQKRLLADWNAGRLSRGQTTPEHANRVAWRNVRDWLKAQFALIDTGMVKADEVLIPYLALGDGRTVYEAFVDQTLKLPAAGETTR